MFAGPKHGSAMKAGAFMTARASSRIVDAINRNFALIGLVVSLALFLILLPQAIFYRGLIFRFAEWQFFWFGTYYPLLSLILPVFLFSALAVALLWLVTRARGKTDQVDNGLEARARRTMLITYSTSYGFLGLAILAFLAALLTCLQIVRLPGDTGPVQTIRVGELPFAKPAEGAAQLYGMIDLQNVTAIRRNFVFFDKYLYFAPMVNRIGPRKSNRYFIQVYRPEFILPNGNLAIAIPEKQVLVENGVVGASKALKMPTKGILLQHGLPFESMWLYRKAGLTVHPDHYVLYRSAADMRFGYWVIAAEFFLLAMISLVIALIQMRSLKKLKAALTAI